MSEELKAKVGRLIEECLNKGNMAVVDEVYASNYVFHNPGTPTITDREGVKKYFTGMRASYPDAHWTIHDLLAAEGDKVVARWTLEGTDTGGSPSLGTPPTGKHFKVTGIEIYRFDGGKIVEEWAEADYLGLMKQLRG